VIEKKIIKYHRLSDLLQRLQNVWTTTNLNKQIVCLPVDAYHINAYERYLYSKNKDMFDKVTLYSTDKVEENFTNITFGTDILDNFPYYEKCDRKYSNAKHFLCLLGTPKRHRINLKKFIFKNNLQSKGIISSIWSGISPDIQKDSDTKWNLNTTHDGTIFKKEIYAKETLDKFYNNCSFEIVTESCSQLITEKTLKPLLYGVPFIFYSNMNNTPTKSLYKDSFKDTEMFDWINVLENIEKIKLNYGIDVNYFNINYKDENSIKNKILELCNLDINGLITKYKQTFKKAKQNQKIIKQYLNKYYEKIG
tara:strand:- start:592 stop:1515 length:924 start_codon:yes stop_codon:yes gene_type:complete